MKMADPCAVAPCLNDRRILRKHLQRWAKNILVVAGLERIAQELMGSRRWRKLVSPFNTPEPKEPKDWDPNDTCYLCHSKAHSSSFNSPNLQHSDEPLRNSSRPALNIDDDDVSKHSALNEDYFDEPLDLSLHSRSKQADNPHDLLLSQKKDRQVTESVLTKHSRRRIESNSNWKRTYTQVDLEAALNDIQSGKLGTRRAAVIYGIPRSTLRNKVYKLEKSKGKRRNKMETRVKSNKFLSQTSASNSTSRSNDTSSDHFSTLSKPNPGSETLKQILKSAIAEKMNNNNNNNHGTSVNTNSLNIPTVQHSEKILEQENTINKVSKQLSELSTILPVFATDPQFYHLFYNIQKIGLNSNQFKHDLELFNDLLIKTHQNFESKDIEKNDKNNNQVTSERKLSNLGKYKLWNVQKSTEESTVSSQFSGEAISEESSSDALNGNCETKSDKNLVKLNASDVSNHEPKRNRPKRGRYRNYNRDDLAKAVKAVQKGEMSVHRAGTLFGVPHSTLEYKVKERHLLRPKKRADPENSGKISEKKRKVKGDQTIEEALCNQKEVSIPKNGDINANPLWNPGVPLPVYENPSNAFFASNMIRKLHENARLNEENHQSEGSEFSGLLEGLIKASQEKMNEKLSFNKHGKVSENFSGNASLANIKEVTALDNKS